MELKTEIKNEKPLTSYEKNKSYIKKYRETNREKYLELQAKYMKKRLDNPILKAENLRKVNERYWRKKEEQEKLEGYKPKKIGRTRKYPHLYEV
jgi:hypothetical protein